VLLFFLYGGLEAGTGLWTSSLLIGTRASSPALAGAAVALFWAALTVGRIAIGLRADAIGPVRALRFAAYSALLAASLLALPGTPLWFAALALAALGLALAPIYPLAMHDTSSRFGSVWGTRLVGYQVAAASLGVATLPWLLGALAERLSLLVLPVLFALLSLALIGLQYARQR
jgi:fucose permease